MHDKRIFANTLKKLMEREHLTQTDLASKLGITATAVSLWCTGKAYPKVSILIKLADIFEVSTDDLLFGIDDKLYELVQVKTDGFPLLFKLSRKKEGTSQTVPSDS